MPPLLNAAPPWQPPLSEYLVLWHGCTAFDKNNIERPGGIDLKYCAVNTDFGRGFYTTTLERQARHWAWDRFFDWQRKYPSKTGNQPVVLRFRVPRYGSSGLDRLLSLAFVRGAYGNEDYWSLVQHCRQSIPGDPAKGIKEVMHDHRRPPGGWYQFVCGPVAAFWEQRVAMDDSDQFSFHADGIDVLNELIKRGRGKGVDGAGDPDTYRWLPVP